jgi:predicted DNA-binding transcriptional regulator
MMVSASFFASYNVSTFYTGVMMASSTALRPVFLYNTWRGYLYETTTPDPIIKVIECCYLKRHEEDLVGEEEAYRLL